MKNKRGASAREPIAQCNYAPLRKDNADNESGQGTYSHKTLTFYKNGKIHSGITSKIALFRLAQLEIKFPENTKLNFYPNGMLKSAYCSRNKGDKSSAKIHFNHNFEIVFSESGEIVDFKTY